MDALLMTAGPWVPIPGPQTDALHNEADVLFYGGAAGGGKSDLLIGAALTRHIRSIIFRREGTQLQGIFQRMEEILGSRDGFNAQDRIWRTDQRIIEFGSCPNLGDEIRYQGRPHDLIGFDEITHFLESQFRFLMGWARTVATEQRVRVICTGNPPTNTDGQWVIDYWAPWLNKDHPNPAQPGELRYFATIDGKDVEMESGETFIHEGETITPQSRSFIPSRIQDNVFLMETGYMASLQALPEPLRSAMLRGDFNIEGEDDPWQVIPTSWIRAAQARWLPKPSPGPMTSMGLDPARGGQDETAIAMRHGNWIAPILAEDGARTPNGPSVAGLAVSHVRHNAPIHVDVIGIGSSVYDHLEHLDVHTVGINWANSSDETDKSEMLRFTNLRAQHWWRAREALDPASENEIALPPDDRLARDLASPRWKLSPRGVQIEAKDDTKKRIGRSPDRGDAVVLCFIETPKRDAKNAFFNQPLKYDTRYVV